MGIGKKIKRAVKKHKPLLIGKRAAEAHDSWVALRSKEEKLKGILFGVNYKKYYQQY